MEVRLNDSTYNILYVKRRVRNFKSSSSLLSPLWKHEIDYLQGVFCDLDRCDIEDDDVQVPGLYETEMKLETVQEPILW